MKKESKRKPQLQLPCIALLCPLLLFSTPLPLLSPYIQMAQGKEGTSRDWQENTSTESANPAVIAGEKKRLGKNATFQTAYKDLNGRYFNVRHVLEDGTIVNSYYSKEENPNFVSSQQLKRGATQWVPYDGNTIPTNDVPEDTKNRTMDDPPGGKKAEGEEDDTPTEHETPLSERAKKMIREWVNPDYRLLDPYFKVCAVVQYRVWKSKHKVGGSSVFVYYKDGKQIRPNIGMNDLEQIAHICKQEGEMALKIKVLSCLEWVSEFFGDGPDSKALKGYFEEIWDYLKNKFFG